jgi:hypothetical protein
LLKEEAVAWAEEEKAMRAKDRRLGPQNETEAK